MSHITNNGIKVFKKVLSNPLLGISLYLAGGVLYDFMDVRTLGNMLAYSGVGQFVISISFLLYKHNALSFLNKFLLEDKCNEAGLKKRIIASLIIFFVPLLLHLMIFAVLSTFDPCNNNSGCMAGSATAYFFILFTIPLAILLLLISVFRLFSSHNRYKKYFKINAGLSIFPFVMACLIYIATKL